MPRIRMRYDGWIALPTTLRRRLALGADAELGVEVENGIIVMRPVIDGGPSRPEPEARMAGTSAEAAPPAKGPGRKRRDLAPIGRKAVSPGTTTESRRA